jgi:hypothetical protein
MGDRAIFKHQVPQLSFRVKLVSELSSLTLEFESRDEIPVKGGRLEHPVFLLSGDLC